MMSEQEKLAKEKICVALDGLSSMEEIKERVLELKDYVGLFKIGLELFTLFGPPAVELIHSLGGKVFLDLKLHDIPKTVERTAKAISKLPISYFTIHASGGFDMMRAARNGVGVEENSAKIIAVTLLTSIDSSILSEQLLVSAPLPACIFKYAKMAEDALLNGVVCSAKDLVGLRSALRPRFIYITPGINLAKDPSCASKVIDHKRLATPREAIGAGSSFLVIGRGVVDKPTPEERVKAAAQIVADISLMV
ncbi:MAG: orotidine-5'-phosphate decarboxylase [Oligoflexia bacterium]|nr:orotidine-5'-phosphate decarboxylase [Oligoflexia bacterium]MBF0364646.1 orotidine-5'-phosphate decarboxylase [Oligoflexia bacterium]